MHVEPPRPSRWILCRNAFLSGVLLLAPLVVTVWAFRKVVDLVGGSFRPFYEDLIPRALEGVPLLWDLLATAVVVVLVTLFGFFSNYVLGKFFWSLAERTIQRIPGVGAVYNAVRQIVATFGSQNRSMFSQVVLVQYPRPGCWTIGFLTNRAQAEPQLRAGAGELWTVFVPTTPNPTSGFLLMLPRAEVVELDMSVGDGMKMILSGGAVTPPATPPASAR
jgi:uncharacterized membrane protein